MASTPSTPSTPRAGSPVEFDNDPVTKDYIEEVMRSYEKNEDYRVRSISSTKLFQYGDNAINSLYRVKVVTEVPRHVLPIGSNEIYTTILVKIPIIDEQNCPPEIFKYEARFYNHLLEPLEDAYCSRLPVIRPIDAQDEVVCLEDYKHTDWYPTNRRDGLNQEQSEKVFRSLARFHSASIMLAHKDDEEFNSLLEFVRDQVFSPDIESESKNTFADAYEVATYFAKQLLTTASEEDSKIIQTFLDMSSDGLFDKAKQALNDTADDMKVFVHGDCWATNVMLKKPDCEDYALLVNLSSVCHSSPARDLVYWFATNAQSVDKSALINAYVEELYAQLKSRKVPDSIVDKFTTKFMEAEIKRLNMLGLLTGIWLLLPINYISHPTSMEYNQTERKDKPKLVLKHMDVDFYNRRLLEILKDYLK